MVIEPTKSVVIPPYYEYTRAVVSKVIDGDTVDWHIDFGMKIYHEIRTRLYGINAPEMRTPEGKAAKLYLELLVSREPIIRLRTFKGDSKDKYGRYLGELITANGSINEMMVEAGHAVVYFP